MSRGGSRRGADRNAEGPDGWAVAGGTPSRAPPKAGDLSQFGKINKPSAGAPMTFGPSSVFNKKDTSKRESASLSRASSVNAFSLLSQNPEIAAEVAAPSSGKSSRAPSRKPSVDLGPGGAPEIASTRRKLNLLPRSKPVGDDASRPASPEGVAFPSTEGGDEETKGGLSEADANKKIDEDIKEFFAIRNVDEGEDYFDKLPAEFRHKLVDKIVTRAIESKEADAQLAADLFARAVKKGLCSAEAFEQGFIPIAEMLDDIAIDAPKAFNLMALMLKGAGLASDEERRARIAEKSMDSDKLLALLS
jgi:translation initiation factor 4G